MLLLYLKLLVYALARSRTWICRLEVCGTGPLCYKGNDLAVNRTQMYRLKAGYSTTELRGQMTLPRFELGCLGQEPSILSS